MVKIGFNNFIFTIFIVIISQCNYIETVVNVCDISQFQKIGNKISCESKNGFSVSCTGPYVSKVYLECENGYFYGKYLNKHIIYCMDDGNWSDNDFHCDPECIDMPNYIQYIEEEQMKFPNSYVEFSRKRKTKGKINEYHGIILSERQILTSSKYFDNEDPNDFYVIIFKFDNEYTSRYSFNFKMEIRKDDEWQPSYETDQLSILTIVPDITEEDNYIKYDNDTKPVCKTISNMSEFNKTDFIQKNVVTNYYKLEHSTCNTPKVDNSKIRTHCVEEKTKNTIQSTICPEIVDAVEMRCQIGYKNYYLEPNNDILSRCVLHKWELFGDEDDCKLVCGEIEQPPLIKLMHAGVAINIIKTPWHVAIFKIVRPTQTVNEYHQICGGTIIHSNVIISAAHCFYDNSYNKVSSPADYVVGAGKTHRNYNASEALCTFANITAIHIPKHFQSHPLQNDIAVLILENHLEYSAYIKPACIDFGTYTVQSSYNINMNENVEGQCVGWGATSPTDESSTELLAVNLSIITNYECAELLGQNKSHISGDKFCAKSENEQFACQGDSGGGFITEKYIRGRLRYFLTGVVSSGVGDKYCSKGFINMFTRVKLYEDFIKQASSPSFLSSEL